MVLRWSEKLTVFTGYIFDQTILVRLIVHAYNANVCIEFSVHDTFLEQSSSVMLIIKILESKLIQKSLGARKRVSQNRLRSPIPERGEP